jgi:rare lipoprotein A (peptidoglycan hydrolase)
MTLRKTAAARWILALLLIALLGAGATYGVQFRPDAIVATADATTTGAMDDGHGASQAATIPPKAVAEAPRKLAACIDRRRMRLGYASWYGTTGNRTANGETYDEHELTAASRYLPFNTQIKVTNLRNGRSVVLRINDRGPFVHKRVIDVTPRAAQLLGMTNRGVVPVYMEIMPKPAPKNEARRATAEMLATAR